jgi:hypothetical protein
MKKSFKVLAIAAIASLTIVACGNNNTEATDTIDSTAIEQVAEEEIIAEPAEVLDTTPVVEEQQAPATSKKVAQTTSKPVVNTQAKEMAKAVSEAKTAEEGTTVQKDATQKSASELRKRRR